MQYPARVSGGESGAKLLRHFNGLVVGKTANAAQERGQVLAVDKFHRQKKPAIALANVIDAAYIGMRDLPRHPHFGVELIAPAGTL
jgi:hypothetical protein